MDIRGWRKKVGLKTDDAVKLLGISRSYLYKIEMGVKMPGRELIKRMSDVYKCSIGEIFLALNTTMSGKTA